VTLSYVFFCFKSKKICGFCKNFFFFFPFTFFSEQDMKTLYFLAFMAAGSSLAIQQQQQPFTTIQPHKEEEIKIHGKYLHITDIHVSIFFSCRVTKISNPNTHTDG
jgi:hypothetical protein